MALPKLNESPKFTLKIPSSGKQLKYRPYLVKEEKVLLMAAESKDAKQMMTAMTDTVLACIEGNVTRDELTTFDLEYIFIKIRTKSVGENVEMRFGCVECDHANAVMVNLDEVECNLDSHENKFKLDEDLVVEMKYPNYENMDVNINDEAELGLEIIVHSIAAVYTKDEKIDVRDEPIENVRAFVESMTSEQFGKISSFLQTMPRVKYESKFVCSSCGHENNLLIEGLYNFFQ